MNTTSPELTLSAEAQESQNRDRSGGLTLGPLTRRIAAAHSEPWQPAWMRHLKAKDTTGRVLS